MEIYAKKEESFASTYMNVVVDLRARTSLQVNMLVIYQAKPKKQTYLPAARFTKHATQYICHKYAVNTYVTCLDKAVCPGIATQNEVTDLPPPHHPCVQDCRGVPLFA